jgi:hypothetical protein
MALGALALGVAAPLVAQSQGVRAGAEDPTAPPHIPGQNLAGMHVYLRAGLKTHGPGYHDYPQWLADFSKVLTAHGAVV